MAYDSLGKQYAIAKKEGRICTQCHWMITKKNWAKGYRLCGNCWSANKGVSTPARWGKAKDEPDDKTGEML
jgi:hypothetical protein